MSHFDRRISHCVRMRLAQTALEKTDKNIVVLNNPPNPVLLLYVRLQQKQAQAEQVPFLSDSRFIQLANSPPHLLSQPLRVGLSNQPIPHPLSVPHVI